MKKRKVYDRWDRAKRHKLFIIALSASTVVTIVVLFSLSWTRGRTSKYNLTFSSEKRINFGGEKVVHVDLKGAPPKVDYFKNIFPLLAKLGATGLLMEYEDMFPYRGPILGNVSATNAYTPQEIQTILQYARESHLHVIPLVQTFGHMEFVLKLKEFRYLREVPEYPQSICPTNEKSLNIILEMIDQVVAAHPNITKLHIGADEVWSLGVCDRCVNLMNKFSWSKGQLFLSHIKAVSEGIRKRHPNVEILMWDDEFRKMSVDELLESRIGSLVEPVVWKYARDVRADLGPALWDTYAEVFPKLWIASAFKGATGSNQYVTDITHHLDNHMSWMSIVAEYESKIQFSGIFITGWQRYDHFAILCELLPVSIPTLATCLRLLFYSNEPSVSASLEVSKMLSCEDPYALVGPPFGIPKCSYPGGKVLDLILRFHQLQEEFLRITDDSRIRGWMSEYNVKYGFSNPQYVETGTTILSNLRNELNEMKVDLRIAMEGIYDNYTIDEWDGTYMQPFVAKVEKLWLAKEKLLSKDYWPRRPFALA